MEFSNITELIGSLASLIAVLLNLSMTFQIRDMWNNQTHEGINPIMLIFMEFNNLSWASYGFLKGDIFIILPNTLGSIFTPIILFLILYFSYKKYLAKKSAEEYLKEELKKF
ncbi:MAG: SWEET family sugar transporter [Methanobrevibacter sp.]|nr:SWEET family sugar transporter [Candidatus Methanovirga basalitermitum]